MPVYYILCANIVIRINTKRISCFSFKHLVLKCLGPDVPSSYLLEIIKSEPETYPADKDDLDSNDTINNKNDIQDDTDSKTKNTLKLVHIKD